MKAIILTADGFEDSEALYPLYRFREEGVTVDVAAPESGPVTGKHGYVIEAEAALSEVRPEDYDTLVLPGGKGPEAVRLDENAVLVAERMMHDGKTVAAICHGPQVLVSAGVLKDRRVTCWAGIRDDVRAAGADYEDSEVVVDDNLITSRCPGDLPAFCRALFARA